MEAKATKKCFGCKKVQPVSNFGWKLKKKNRRKSRCRRCDATWRAREYRHKSVAYRSRINKVHAELRAIVLGAKNAPCLDCGRRYPPYVMDFDHRNSKEKVSKVSNLMRLGSRQKLLTEIAKCDLVCSNCHRERTHQRSI
jgi:hypothetical protein